MDSSSANQEMGSQTLESMLVCTRVPPHQQEKKPRPADEQSLKCPRCDSANTKFCYYNNYSLSQPRYFCKSCRRYWTKGGTLRNVPVGGGCRKNKRPSSSSSSSSSSAANKIRNGQEQSILPMSVNPSPLIPLSSSNPPLSSSYDHHSSCNDLSLAIARLHKQSALGFDQEHDHHHFAMWANNNNNPNMSGEVLGMNSHDSNNNAHVNTSLGLFDALGSGDGAFLHHQHAPSSGGTGNFYGSLIMGMIGHDHHHHHQMGSLESNGGIGIIQDSGIECDREYGGGVTMASTAVTTLKQEIGSRSNDQNRVLWGFPWQVNGDGHVGNNQPIAWNGIGSGNNWHGLLNSPLM